MRNPELNKQLTILKAKACLVRKLLIEDLGIIQYSVKVKRYVDNILAVSSNTEEDLIDTLYCLLIGDLGEKLSAIDELWFLSAYAEVRFLNCNNVYTNKSLTEKVKNVAIL